jgi:hypothetical protein
MPAPRLTRILSRTILAAAIVLSFLWVSIYFGSLIQRHKAERLLSDMKSFPFATSGSVAARDFVAKRGGHPIQPKPGDSETACTDRNCDFEVLAHSPFYSLASTGTGTEILYRALIYSGIRPWAVTAYFEVREGKIDETRTRVLQVKIGKLGVDHSSVLMFLAYEISTSRRNCTNCWLDDGREYGVWKPHVTGGPGEYLEAAAVLDRPDLMARVFDVDLRCFTSIWHDCRDFGELAPSAWADHERKVNRSEDRADSTGREATCSRKHSC